jgi:hypothetical protein
MATSHSAVTMRAGCSSIPLLLLVVVVVVLLLVVVVVVVMEAATRCLSDIWGGEEGEEAVAAWLGTMRCVCRPCVCGCMGEMVKKEERSNFGPSIGATQTHQWGRGLLTDREEGPRVDDAESVQQPRELAAGER